MSNTPIDLSQQGGDADRKQNEESQGKEGTCEGTGGGYEGVNYRMWRARKGDGIFANYIT